MIRAFKMTLVVVSLLFACFVGAIALAFQDAPLVVSTSNQKIDQAESVNQLFVQLKKITLNRYDTQHVLLSTEQLNSFIGLAQRAFPEFTGHLELTETTAALQLTYLLPDNPIGDYLNIQMTIVDDKKLNMHSMQVGSLVLPANLTLKSFILMADWWTNSDIASMLLAQIKQIRIDPGYTVVTLKPVDELLKHLNTVRNGIGIQQDDRLRVATAHYLKYLSELPVPEHRPSSLLEYMVPLFEEVKRCSLASPANFENEAAILALAIYTGHHRIANFVGSVQPTSDKVVLPKFRPLLAGRTDLTQHFVVSAALQVLSQRQMSFAIGEFKELMDRASGGSGYSFVDIAADLAGVKFAQRASNKKTATDFQQLVITLSNESAFFPHDIALPEGLNKQQFVAEYGSVDSEKYKRKLQEIHSTLNQLSLFRQDVDAIDNGNVGV